jgi:hypothetical protein
MKKVLKYLAAAVLFSFSVSSHAEQVSSELAQKILTEGEPIASGKNGFDSDSNVTWAQAALRFDREIYVCQININLTYSRVHAFCFDQR